MSKADHDSTSLASIVESFIQAATGNASGPSVRAPGPSVRAPATVEDEDDFMFNPDKDVALQTMRNLGWIVGMVVSPRKPPDAKAPHADTQYELAHINDDGSVGLTLLDKNGVKMEELIAVPQQDVSKKYKLVDNAHRAKTDKTYPMHFLSEKGTTARLQFWK